jgi:hypothetical protein
MLSKNNAIEIMQLCLNSLTDSGMIDQRINVVDSSALFGQGSSLDSMGFVTFVTEVEENVINLTGKDIFIVLSDIEEMYPDEPFLSASMFADYLVSLTQ